MWTLKYFIGIRHFMDVHCLESYVHNSFTINDLKKAKADASTFF